MREKRMVQVVSPEDRFTGLVAKKIGRNELCPCGSGLKSKKCCGSAAKYFSREKMKKVKDEEARKRRIDKIK
jgi:hypothetical protein